MTKEIRYSYKDLFIDFGYLSAVLGFPDGVLPEPFDAYVAEAMEKAPSLCDIRGAWYFSDKLEFVEKNKHILVKGIEFKTGRTIAKELENATSIAFFICTAGKEISNHSRELMNGEDPVLGYVYDVLGSMIVEAATDLLQEEIKKIAHSKGMAISNRYSPGYCKWDVADQHKLFSFFPSNFCGISLTDSALMDPIKSISGIIGVGKEIKFREYTCNICNQVDCILRKQH